MGHDAAAQVGRQQLSEGQHARLDAGRCLLRELDALQHAHEVLELLQQRVQLLGQQRVDGDVEKLEPSSPWLSTLSSQSCCQRSCSSTLPSTPSSAGRSPTS